jgi:hypothetical protein
VHPDAATGLPDAGPDLQEFEAQGIDLVRSQFRALEVLSQKLKQAVGRGVEQQPGLIGQEAMATQVIYLDIQLQFLDAVFHIAPKHVNVVIDKLGVAHQVSDYEALVGAQTGIFHFGDKPAGLVPGFCLIAEGGEESLFIPRLLILRCVFAGAARSLPTAGYW